MKSECEVRFSLPSQVRFATIDGEEEREANGWRLNSLPGIDPAGTVTAITAAVVGALFLIYQSVPKWTPEICDGVDQ